MESVRQHILPLVFAIGLLGPAVAMWVLRPGFAPAAAGGLAPARPMSWGLRIALALFLAAYAAAVLHGADFGLSDHDQFTRYSLAGRDRQPHVWPEVGRFLPLALQEFNLVRHASTSMAGYLSVCIAQLLATLYGIGLLLRDARPGLRAGAQVLFALTPGVAIAFADPVFSERNLVLLLMLMLCATMAWERTRSPWAFFAAAAAAHFALYYKETAFLPVGAYMLARMLLRAGVRDMSQATPAAAPRRWIAGNALELTVLALVAVFLCLYLALVAGRGDATYADEHALGLVTVVARYLRYDPWLWVLPAVGVLRLRQWRAGRRLDPFWDPLPVAALAMLAGYIGLRLHEEFYVAPIDVLLVPWCAWVACGTFPRAARMPAALVGAALAINMAAHSGLHLMDQKARVAGQVALTRFVATQAAAAREPVLYFPRASGWDLMLLSTFMDYWAGRNLDADASARVRSVVLDTPLEIADGRCFSPHHDGRCRHAEAPARGAWIVWMPRQDRLLGSTAKRGNGDAKAKPEWRFAPAGERLADGLATLSLVHRLPARWNRVMVYREP